MADVEKMQELSERWDPDDDFLHESSVVLRQVLIEKRLTYAGLAARLKACGYDETELSVSHKVRRGKYQMRFFFQCMRALGLEEVRLRLPKETVVSGPITSSGPGVPSIF